VQPGWICVIRVRYGDPGIDERWCRIVQSGSGSDSNLHSCGYRSLVSGKLIFEEMSSNTFEK
jgi:hypothetical protein